MRAVVAPAAASQRLLRDVFIVIAILSVAVVLI